MHRRGRVVLFAGILCLGLMLKPGSAVAGFFIDAYFGGVFTSDSDVDMDIVNVISNTKIDTETGLAAGGRLGYWFGLFPWLGLALDVSYFETEGDPASRIGTISIPTFDNLPDADFGIIPISALVMVRLPNLLDPAQLLTGLNLYAGIGPALTLTSVDFEDFSAFSTTFGLDVRVGLQWKFLPIVGVFVEYRYFRVEDDFQDILRDSTTSLDVVFSTHHVLGGVSLNF